MSRKERIKEWLVTNKKALLKALLVITIIAAIGVSSFFILKACGFTTKEDFLWLKDKLGDSIGFWAVIVGLQIFQVIFIPISNSLISAPVSYIFNDEIWKVFLSSWIGITIATIALYFIGKYGGRKVLGWVLGDKKKVESCSKFMRKGKAFFVLGDLIPFIPNDILTVLAGMSNYNFLFVFIVTVITRAICIATTCWLFGLAAKYPWVWAILAVLIAFMIFATIYMFRRELKKDKKPDEDDILDAEVNDKLKINVPIDNYTVTPTAKEMNEALKDTVKPLKVSQTNQKGAKRRHK